MAETVLVVGATGLLGRPVAHHLRGAGFGVRVMSRRASQARAAFPEPFEIVEGDALSRADVAKALAGCDGVHVSVDHEREDECVAQVVEAARGAGLHRITYVSGTTVCEENRWFPIVDRKLKAEHAIAASGVDFTIFRPGWFMEMVPRLVRDGRATVFGKPTRRWHFVSVQDFARMVTESYQRTEAVGKRFYVHGPQALTLPEALQTYCEVLHPEITTISHVPYWVLRLIAWSRGNEVLRRGLDMVAYLEKVGERGDAAEANAILGAPRLTLEAWAQLQKRGSNGEGTAARG